jgi:hypothetical protein
MYLIVNLVDNRVEAHLEPDPASALYRKAVALAPGEVLTIPLPDGGHLDIPVRDLIP